jgi:lincosamide nucleotidyltransferase B/F
MLIQEMLIENLRKRCREDKRVIAATLYGSFAVGEGDAFSDIECALFFEPAALATLDKRQWTGQIAPVLVFFADDFGHDTAIFDGLIRGEFHFEPVEKLSAVASWRGNAWFPELDQAILVDRTGELRAQMQTLAGDPPLRDTPETVQRLIDNFINVVIFGLNTLERGELARSLEILGLCHRYLLWLARLVESSSTHWPTPSRRLEQDLSRASYERFIHCTARLERPDLCRAYLGVWRWGIEMATELAQRHRLALSAQLLELVTQRTSGLAG